MTETAALSTSAPAELSGTLGTRPRVGVALGSGAARGWAHIGVLHELAAMGVEPSIVAGCSIGAVVGAAYAADNLGRLEKQLLGMGRLDLVRFFDLGPSLNGFVHRQRLQQFLHDYVCVENQTVAGLKRGFAAVATHLESGREIWLDDGKVHDAILASIALPGMFPAVRHAGGWVVDGGLVNPLPVSLCRAMGADVVIAVNLNGAANRHFPSRRPTRHQPGEAGEHVALAARRLASGGNLLESVAASLRGYSAALFNEPESKDEPPGVVDTILGSINLMQDRIMRSRMVGDPPEVLLSPRLSDISLLEFHRAEEAIAAGRDSVLRMRHEIEALLEK